MSAEERGTGMGEREPAGTEQGSDREVLTWAGLEPDEHARRVAARAGGSAAKVPAEHREDVQRYRLRVVDDDVYSEEHWRCEDSRFTDPKAAVEHVRECYRGEYAHGLYELEPVYVRRPGDREQTVPFGEPLNGDVTLWAVGYVRDYPDPTSGHSCGETVTLTGYVDRERAEELLAETRASDPDFDGYFLVPDRNEPEDLYEEPPDDDGDDPFDDGTIGYDYYGPSWPLRDI